MQLPKRSPEFVLGDSAIAKEAKHYAYLINGNAFKQIRVNFTLEDHGWHGHNHVIVAIGSSRGNSRIPSSALVRTQVRIFVSRKARPSQAVILQTSWMYYRYLFACLHCSRAPKFFLDPDFTP